MNLENFIKSELLTNPDQNTEERIEYLLKAFPSNKTILNEIELSHNTIIFSPKQYNNIHTLLKKYWLNTWKIHALTKEDLPIIEKYFNNYNLNQQQFLIEKIKKEKLKLPKLVTKKVPALTIALNELSNGNYKPLLNHINNNNLVNKNKIRILNFLNNHHIYLNMELLISFFKKNDIHQINDYNKIKNFVFCSESEKFIELINIIGKENDKDFKLRAITGLNIADKKVFLYSISSLIINRSEGENISNFTENVDYLLKHRISNFIKIKFKTEKTGIEALDIIIKEITQKRKINLDDTDYKYIEDFYNLMKSYYLNKKLNANLNINNLKKNKIKI